LTNSQWYLFYGTYNANPDTKQRISANIYPQICTPLIAALVERHLPHRTTLVYGRKIVHCKDRVKHKTQEVLWY